MLMFKSVGISLLIGLFYLISMSAELDNFIQKYKKTFSFYKFWENEEKHN